MEKDAITPFLVLQFPFSDLRGFIPGDGARLARPSWPFAEPDRDFLRCSGLVQSRRRGGVAEWAGEELYGNASGALKFPDRLSQISIAAGKFSGSFKCAFRRFYSDGIVARVELGLQLISDSADQMQPIDANELFKNFLNLAVTVRRGRRTIKATRLIDAGEPLARHFLRATSDYKLTEVTESPNWWFSHGTPSIVFEHSTTVALPLHSREILRVAEAGATISHAWVQIGNQRCSVWFVSRDEGNKDALRRLRLHLVRLHAERECLRNVLLGLRRPGCLKLEKQAAESEAVQQYLTDATGLIEKGSRLGINQSALLEAVRTALGDAFEGETATLKLVRRQVALKVQGYIDRARNTSAVINNIQGNMVNTTIQLGNVNVTGDFNVVTAENISNSFNKAAKADVSSDLRDKLKSVTVEVANLVKELPPEKAEQVSKDLNTFTTEVISKQPRREWWELSSKGLLDAAKSVAKMTVPITTAVKAVLALLA